MSMPSTPQSHWIDCGGATLHVRVWPGDRSRTLVIWHGITGTSLDHVVLADRLSARGWFVVAPDSLGCGASDWADEPRRGYGFGALAPYAIRLLDLLEIERTAWLGISKGGGLGICLAADTPERIACLALCDVGVGLPTPVREALAKRLADPPRFVSVAAFRDHVARLLARNHLADRVELADRLALAWHRRIGHNAVTYHYDPALAHQFSNNPEDFDLWSQWERGRCPTLVLRAEHSTVLSQAEVDAMRARRPAMRSAMLAGAGHLTFLEDYAQQDTFIDFVESIQTS